MECKDIHKRLSAYIERAVSPQQKTVIDKHLKQCKRCRQALADLKRTIDYVRRLEEVEPPPWLAQRVMARVRAEAEEKPGIIKRLFYPLHIKLPLEAIAVIFIAVGALYIFKTMQPQMQLAKLPTETRKMAPAPATAPKKEAPSALKKERPAPILSRDQLMYDKQLETRGEKSMGKAKAPARMMEQEAAAPTVPEAGTTYRDESDRRGVLAPTAVSPKRAAESKVKEVHFLVHVEDLETASRDIEETLRQLGGREITTSPLKDKAMIDAEINANKLQKLTDQLHLIGEVQGKGLTMETREGDLEIRIDLEKTSK
jgi:DNA-binding FrmR family transcriptional regulator